MASLHKVPTHLAHQALDAAVPYIKRGYDRVEALTPMEVIIEGVLNGQKDLWCIVDGQVTAWCVSEIIDNVAFIWLGSGEGLSSFDEAMGQFTEWAKDQGCRGVQFYGRPGWQKVLKDHGFKVKQVIMHKEL